MSILGVTEDDSFTKILKQYNNLVKNLKVVQAQQSEDQENTIALLKTLDQAIETVKVYRLTHGNNYEKLEVKDSLTKEETKKAPLKEQ